MNEEKWIEGYKTDDMTKCEYKPYINMDRPKQHDNVCDGYINPYTNKPSKVCMACKFFKENNKR